MLHNRHQDTTITIVSETERQRRRAVADGLATVRPRPNQCPTRESETLQENNMHALQDTIQMTIHSSS